MELSTSGAASPMDVPRLRVHTSYTRRSLRRPLAPVCEASITLYTPRLEGETAKPARQCIQTCWVHGLCGGRASWQQNIGSRVEVTAASKRQERVHRLQAETALHKCRHRRASLADLRC